MYNINPGITKKLEHMPKLLFVLQLIYNTADPQ